MSRLKVQVGAILFLALGSCDRSSEPAGATGDVLPVTSGGCRPGVPDDASCVRVRVGCPGLEEVHATIAVTEPDGPARGTIVLHGGGAGTEAFDEGFVPELLGRGFRTVQISWDEDWQLTTPASIRDAACRPATALEWIFEQYHHADRTSGYCAIGHAAGSAAVAYSLAHYGAGDLLDHALLSGGPVLSRVDAACDPVGAGFGGRSMRPSGCEEFPVASFVYTAWQAQEVVRWSGEETCGAPYGDLSDAAALREQSILSDGASLYYPQTRLDTWWCSDDASGAAGQGTFFADEVDSELVRHCATGCDGEASFTNPAELVAMADNVALECVPRHEDGAYPLP